MGQGHSIFLTAGVILAGGHSRRFGREKAVAVLGGRSLLDWSLEALQGSCETIAVSAAAGSGAQAWAEGAQLAVLMDDPGHPRGPLSGLAAALIWARAQGFDTLASLPCDTPRVGPRRMQRLAAALGDAPAVYALTPGGPHPLVAIWRTDLAEPLRTCLNAGDHPAVQDYLQEIGAQAWGFDDQGFENVNRESDLARLEILMKP